MQPSAIRMSPGEIVQPLPSIVLATLVGWAGMVAGCTGCRGDHRSPPAPSVQSAQAAPAQPESDRSVSSPSVLTYHNGAGRSGHYVAPGLTWNRARTLHRDARFHATVDGHVYAQPLYWHPAGEASGMLVVATESNVVYALNATTGAQVWRRSLGTPAARGDLPCGNIDPLGITGTPAIDATRGAVYLDAVVNGGGGGVRHLLYGLSLRDGSVLPGWPVDVAQALSAKGESFTPRVQNERGALLILHDVLYVPYGGHWGDCGAYHGWVVGVSLRDPKQITAWRTRGRAGGIWAPGGVASDGTSLFVTTGNTMGVAQWSDGEAIIRLAPGLARSDQRRDFFAPANWQALDNQDGDLGGVAPLPLDVLASHGTRAMVLALGKDGKAYLADRNDLGGIGGAVVSLPVSNRSIRTSEATWTTHDGVSVAFQGAGAGCPNQGGGRSGVVALAIAGTPAPSVRVAWCASLDGAGAPVVTTSAGNADPIVWITGAEGDDRLHGFRGDTGEELFSGGGAAETMRGLRHFGTILVADGRLYVAGDGEVYAFIY